MRKIWQSSFPFYPMVGVTEMRTAFTLSAYPAHLLTQADQCGLFSEPECTMPFWNSFFFFSEYNNSNNFGEVLRVFATMQARRCVVIMLIPTAVELWLSDIPVRNRKVSHISGQDS